MHLYINNRISKNCEATVKVSRTCNRNVRRRKKGKEAILPECVFKLMSDVAIPATWEARGRRISS
jgi:hypothetical protein